MSLWDLKAKIYAHARNLPPFNFILKQELSHTRALLSHADFAGATVLDVGTGTGTILNFLPKTARLFAVDRSFNMLGRARRQRPLPCTVADSLNLPFRSKSFTLATAVGIFEYQEDRDVFLQELQRVLSPAGFLLLTYSQKRFLNYARTVFGHKVYLLADSEFRMLLKRSKFVCRAEKKSLIQRQVLLQVNFEDEEEKE